MSEENEAPKPKRGPKSASYSLAKPCNFNILGVKIGQGFKPSDDQKKNQKFMAKLEHAVEIGIVVKG